MDAREQTCESHLQYAELKTSYAIAPILSIHCACFRGRRVVVASSESKGTRVLMLFCEKARPMQLNVHPIKVNDSLWNWKEKFVKF
jgi:hypothetical protein